MVLLDLPLSSDYFLSFFAAAHVRPRIVERTRDLAVMQSLVGNDFGYSIANLKPVSNRSPDGRALHFIPISGPVEPMRLGLLSAAGGRSSPAIRAFVDYCREVLPDQIVPDLVVGPAAPQGEA
jgi:DNA-binding transcriptional LysR family regulator